MFQNSQHPRSRLATRKPLGDENSLVSRSAKDTAVGLAKGSNSNTNTTATGKLIKEATRAGALKSKLATKTTTTALGPKVANAKRNALGNLINQATENSAIGKPARPVTTTTGPVANRLRSTATRATAKATAVGTLKTRASTSRLGTSVPTTRPTLRNKASSQSLPGAKPRAASSTTTTATTTTQDGSFKSKLPGPQPLERLDSQSTLRDEAPSVDTDMDLDGEVVEDTSDCESDITITSSVKEPVEVGELKTPEVAELDPTSLEYILANFEEEIDLLDTTMVPEYTTEIFTYMRKMEIRMKPLANYMDTQSELEWKMRGILIDWLVQVHLRFRLLPETLFLCVNYIDRFLSLKVISLEKLQLVGVVALLIAAKFEEIQVPSINDFVYMVDNAYTIEEVMKAERFMLSLLNFDLGFPGPMSFLRRISKADDYDIQTRTLAKYLIEVTIMDEQFLPFVTSHTAAAGHFLARQMLNKGEWTDAHVFYSGYTESMLAEVTQLLLQNLANPKSHSTIYEKYADRKFMKASVFVQQWMTANHPELVHKAASSAKSSPSQKGE